MDSWNTWLAGPGWSALAPWLATYHLPKQRWFGGKGVEISSVSIHDAGWLPREGGQVLLLIARVRAESGQEDDYFVPLWFGAVSQAENGFGLTGPDGPVFVADAGTIDTACRSLVSLIERNASVPCSKGTISGFPCGSGLQVTSSLILRRSSAEQSNTSFFLGDQYVCKLLRRLPEGINPDYEVSRYLTETAGFKNAPALHGAIEYRRPGQEPRTLAMAQQFVPNMYDGWEQATRVLREYAEQKPNAPVGLGKYGQCVELLGKRTAELHLALSAADTEPFKPEVLDPTDLEHTRIRIQAGAAAWLEERLAQMHSREDVTRARYVLQRRLDSLVGDFQLFGSLGRRIRCHGDYHLGQVLWTGSDYVILDFEGEPTRSLAERRAKHSPLKDVAGMLRSFAYAEGYVPKLLPPGSWTNGMIAAMDWKTLTRVTFLKAYRLTMNDSDLVPQNDETFAFLLSLYVLDKAFYEIDYERRHRPDWEHIPQMGIADELASLDELNSESTA